jgi:putative SOS response-associated peptidase YedK
VSWKLSSTVLRGGANGNVGSPLGKRNGKGKQPYCFEVGEREPFAFAGLWDRWRAPDETPLETCTILTTTPNRLPADVHDRMPVILSPADYDLWLDPGFREVAATSEMLRPFDGALMRRYPVSERVNSVANDDAGCSEPIESFLPVQAGLFR